MQLDAVLLVFFLVLINIPPHKYSISRQKKKQGDPYKSLTRLGLNHTKSGQGTWENKKTSLMMLPGDKQDCLLFRLFKIIYTNIMGVLLISLRSPSSFCAAKKTSSCPSPLIRGPAPPAPSATPVLLHPSRSAPSVPKGLKKKDSSQTLARPNRTAPSIPR